MNALRVVGKRLEDVRIVTTGCGAAGTAVTKILLAAGARHIVGCDEGGALYSGRPGLSPAKQEYADLTNPDDESGTADEMLAGADVFIGVSVPGAVTRAGIARMARGLDRLRTRKPTSRKSTPRRSRTSPPSSRRADPTTPTRSTTSSSSPASSGVRSTCGQRAITKEMELAAAHALAGVIPSRPALRRLHHPQRLRPQRRTTDRAAVAEAALAAGVARVGVTPLGRRG